MEVKVHPSESALDDPVQVRQCAVGADQEPSPQHRMDAPNPDIDQRGGGLRDRRPLAEEPEMGFGCPRFEMDPYCAGAFPCQDIPTNHTSQFSQA
jgi:hypothetical protein